MLANRTELSVTRNTWAVIEYIHECNYLQSHTLKWVNTKAERRRLSAAPQVFRKLDVAVLNAYSEDSSGKRRCCLGGKLRWKLIALVNGKMII